MVPMLNAHLACRARIVIVSFLSFLSPGSSPAQEQNPGRSCERAVSILQQTGINGEAGRFGLLTPPSTPSALPQVSLNIVLPQPSEAEQASLEPAKSDRGGPLQIGFGRTIPAEYRGDLAARLKWSSNDETGVENGPVAAALTVTSPEATALRIGLRAKLAAGDTIHFSSPSDPEQEFRPFTHEDFGSSADVVWSPVIEGDTVRVDLSLSSLEALPTFSLLLDRVSHIATPISRFATDSLLDVDE